MSFSVLHVDNVPWFKHLCLSWVPFLWPQNLLLMSETFPLHDVASSSSTSATLISSFQLRNILTEVSLCFSLRGPRFSGEKSRRLCKVKFMLMELPVFFSISLRMCIQSTWEFSNNSFQSNPNIFSLSFSLHICKSGTANSFY